MAAVPVPLPGQQARRQSAPARRRRPARHRDARELLGGTVETLDRTLARLEAEALVDADALAGDVTTVFNNQRLFTESVRDFYAYRNQVLSRYDLAGAEYSSFKTLLLK
jgi:hypothetical protein